ncbi:hypothetical protein BKA81DRAFT_124436 [Phyllosticta paracitricarpa]
MRSVFAPLSGKSWSDQTRCRESRGCREARAMPLGRTGCVASTVWRHGSAIRRGQDFEVEEQAAFYVYTSSCSKGKESWRFLWDDRHSNAPTVAERRYQVGTRVGLGDSGKSLLHQWTSWSTKGVESLELGSALLIRKRIAGAWLKLPRTCGQNGRKMQRVSYSH